MFDGFALNYKELFVFHISFQLSLHKSLFVNKYVFVCIKVEDKKSDCKYSSTFTLLKNYMQHKK